MRSVLNSRKPLIDSHASGPASSPDRCGLSKREEQEAIKRSSPRAVVVHEAIRKEGEEEITRPTQSLAWSGLAAGLAMGLSMMGDGLIRAGLPDAPWRDLVTSLGYTIGFLVVVLGRQQLFTENTVTAVLPFLHALDHALDLKTLGAVARLWGIVLATNLMGTLLFAAGAGLTNAFDEETRRSFLEIGRHVAESGFSTTFTRAVIAGWLIALMVRLPPAAGLAKFLVQNASATRADGGRYEPHSAWCLVRGHAARTNAAIRIYQAYDASKLPMRHSPAVSKPKQLQCTVCRTFG